MTTLERRTERARWRNRGCTVAAILLVAITMGNWFVWWTLGCSVVPSAPALMCVSPSQIRHALGCEPLKVRELLSARYEQLLLARRISMRVESTADRWGDLAQRCALQSLAPGTWHHRFELDGQRSIRVSRSDDTTVVEIVWIRTFLQGSGDLDLDPVDP